GLPDDATARGWCAPPDLCRCQSRLRSKPSRRARRTNDVHLRDVVERQPPPLKVALTAALLDNSALCIGELNYVRLDRAQTCPPPLRSSAASRRVLSYSMMKAGSTPSNRPAPLSKASCSWPGRHGGPRGGALAGRPRWMRIFAATCGSSISALRSI